MSVIVVSGPPGVGGTTVAKGLAERLKLDFFCLGNYFKKQGEGDNEDEKAMRFWVTSKGSSKEFHVGMDDTQRKLAKEGDIVIQSKLGIRMLKGSYDFSVWLDAPLSVRAQRASKRDGIPVFEAEDKILERQTLERKTWKTMYGFDYFTQEKEADIVIDTSDKKPNLIIDLIINEMKRKNII
jgi:cytidylate kinase